MKKVIIIGGGFSGITAARKLSKYKKLVEVILVDKRSYSSFLPALPDIIGERINSKHLRFSLDELGRRIGFSFLNEEVEKVDLEGKKVITKEKTFLYDFLIIAGGSETNFYGSEQIEQYAYKLDDVDDASKISCDIEGNNFDTYLVVGGGYTGIEIATNLRRFLNGRGKEARVIIVELAPTILGILPEWMKKYVVENIKNMGIEVLVNTSIEKIEEKEVALSDNQVFKNSMLIWAAGVKTPGFVQNLTVERSRQGRIKVDGYLQLKNDCFVVGDDVQLKHKGNILRMAVQFSIAQAEVVSSNIIRSIKAKSLSKYKPLDLGYIIPMANNRSCGRILGVNMKGLAPTVLHYFMCIYRSYGLTNKIGIIKDLLKGGVR